MPRRDEVRNRRSKINARLKELGVDMTAERAKSGTNTRNYVVAGMKLINDGTPRHDSRQLQVDDPPDGAFNGANTSFQLSDKVKGINIVVVWHNHATNEKWVLTRSTASPPLHREFFFDRSNPTEIEVGDAPNAGDGLTAIYMVER